MNPGGVRSDLTYADSTGEGVGVVTYGEVFTFQPFNNQLVTYAMTGAEIISVLEEQCQPIGSSRPFLQSPGRRWRFTYDLATTIAAGDCTSVTISNVKLNGVALDPAAMYNVTVNNFLADGGDNFTTFGTITTPALRRRERPASPRQLLRRLQPGGSPEHRPGERAAGAQCMAGHRPGTSPPPGRTSVQPGGFLLPCLPGRARVPVYALEARGPAESMEAGPCPVAAFATQAPGCSALAGRCS